jgi:hypothetical protein
MSAQSDSSKKAPDTQNSNPGLVNRELRNGYLVFNFEPLWLLADMYILLGCLVV